MRIIYPWNSFDPGNKVTREYGVKVDRADQVGFFKKEEKEQSQVKFRIKKEPFIKETGSPGLIKGHDRQRNRRSKFSSKQRYMITGGRKGSTDADHSLVVAQIVGNRKNQFF
jgi:hypothetical protein